MDKNKLLVRADQKEGKIEYILKEKRVQEKEDFDFDCDFRGGSGKDQKKKRRGILEEEGETGWLCQAVTQVESCEVVGRIGKKEIGETLKNAFEKWGSQTAQNIDRQKEVAKKSNWPSYVLKSEILIDPTFLVREPSITLIGDYILSLHPEYFKVFKLRGQRLVFKEPLNFTTNQ